MVPHLQKDRPHAANRRYRGVLTSVLALVMAFPSAAHPYNLEQLLKLPLERLLVLKITSRRVAEPAEQRSLMPADRAIDGGDDAP